MSDPRPVLVRREQIARAGGVRAAVEEALSLAALGITPPAMTAYEAVGMSPADEEGVGVLLQVEVGSEEELREAIGAGAEVLVLVGVNQEQSRRLGEVAKKLRSDIKIQNLENTELQRHRRLAEERRVSGS